MLSEPLPKFYMMTGQYTDYSDFNEKLTNALIDGNKVVQLKNKNALDNDEFLQLAQMAKSICQQFNTILLMATSADIFKQSQADGLHLNSQVLFEYDSRPVLSEKILSVSCHNLEEMKQAEKLGADILLLSPVKATASHPELEAIGWIQFKQMIDQLKCPVYALGGMSITDIDNALDAGAQGIAVSSFWK
jgi:8-oxo-dGTP diphosphatase